MAAASEGPRELVPAMLPGAKTDACGHVSFSVPGTQDDIRAGCDERAYRSGCDAPEDRRQPLLAHLADLERQTEPVGRRLRRPVQLGRALLREPYDPAVVAE